MQDTAAGSKALISGTTAALPISIAALVLPDYLDKEDGLVASILGLAVTNLFVWIVGGISRRGYGQLPATLLGILRG